MPRFTNSQLNNQNSCLIRKKIISGCLKNGGNKKKNVPIVKNIIGDIRNKKYMKPLRLLKTRSHDVICYPLLLNENYVLPSNIFGFTQKRHCCWVNKPGEERMWGDGPRVAIVGAGIAGLSAATHLADNGFNNFQIFEASSRLGGRINTAKFAKGGTCELGGEWLSGGDVTNGLIIMANQEGLLANVDWRNNRQLICLTSEGRALCSEICCIGRQIFNKVSKEAHRLFLLASDIKHGTLSYFLDRRINEELRGFSEYVLENLQRLMLALKNDLRVHWGAELGKMSSDLLGSYAEEPGNSLRLKGGLVSALLPLVRKIPEKKIHLSTSVKTIFWGQDKTSVVLENGREIPADFIIITVPLGFLKKNYESFFHPKLPQAKAEAIEKMGYGKMTKIFMKYPTELWGQRRTEISTLWKKRDWSDRQTYWYKGISSVHVQGDIASVMIGGPEAAAVEDETAETIAHDLTALLRCFTGSSALPVPQELLKSRWNSDNLHYGSGSYMTLDTRLSDPTNLSLPVTICGDDKPKLLFAGEATCPDRLNTIQGARSTGIREAQRVLDSIATSEKNKEIEEESW